MDLLRSYQISMDLVKIARSKAKREREGNDFLRASMLLHRLDWFPSSFELLDHNLTYYSLVGYGQVWIALD